MTYRGNTVESGDREASALGKWAQVALRIRVIVAVMGFVAVVVVGLLLPQLERGYGGSSNLIIVAPDLLLASSSLGPTTAGFTAHVPASPPERQLDSALRRPPYSSACV